MLRVAELDKAVLPSFDATATLMLELAEVVVSSPSHGT